MEHFVPPGPVLEKAAVAITHGGMGATQKALAHGVPVVVVPFGRDQHEVAARVVASGSAARTSPRRSSAPRSARPWPGRTGRSGWQPAMLPPGERQPEPMLEELVRLPRS